MRESLKSIMNEEIIVLEKLLEVLEDQHKHLFGKDPLVLEKDVELIKDVVSEAVPTYVRKKNK